MSDDNSKFSVLVDGVTVEGEIIERWSRVVAVRLASPFGVLSSSCSVPYFAIGHADFSGPQGDAMARTLLTELYRKALLFDRYRHVLRERWQETEAKLEAVAFDDPDRPEIVRDQKLATRRRFRSGELDQRAYQRELKALSMRERAYGARQSAIVDAFMASPPWRDNVDLGQVVAFLGIEDEKT